MPFAQLDRCQLSKLCVEAFTDIEKMIRLVHGLKIHKIWNHKSSKSDIIVKFCRMCDNRD